MKIDCFKKAALLSVLVLIMLITVFACCLSVNAAETDVASPAAITVSPDGSFTADHSNDSNAAMRMQPLKQKLAELQPAEVEKEAAKYSDIVKHWSRVQDAKLSSLEIIKGYSNGTFKPDSAVTVAEFVTMTVKVLGYKLEVNHKYWAQNFIDQAIKDGLFKKGDFDNYNRPITREEVAKLVVNAATQYDKAPSHEYDNVIINRIRDYKEIKDMLKQSVIDANHMGLMSPYGDSGKFLPRNSLTRAEGATVILRLLDDNDRAKFVPRKDEMIEVTNKYTHEKAVLTSTFGPEIIPMTHKIIEAAKKTTGYIEVTSSDENRAIGVSIWDTKEHADDYYGRSPDIDIDISLSTGNYEHPYTIIIRNAQRTKEYHMEFMKELLKMFYGSDSEKVIENFSKILDSAVKIDDKFYRIWTYQTGVKYNGRGILLEKGVYNSEMLIWIYRK